MTAKEKLKAAVDRLSEAEAVDTLDFIGHRVERNGDPDGAEMVGLPDAWKTFPDGTPVPNWVALLHEARAPAPTASAA